MELQDITALSQAVAKSTRSSRFFASGEITGVDPGLVVDGLGKIRMPFPKTKKLPLIAQCQPAPYGKGAETLVDTTVRNSYQLEPEYFLLGEDWHQEVERITRKISAELGYPEGALEASIYKLLVYESGGFFLPHRDSEKLDRMVASLIVVLPSKFTGGELLVRHGVIEEEFQFQSAKDIKAADYVAFFADCEHEVERVSSGVKICLAYNLAVQPDYLHRLKPKKSKSANDLQSSIEEWIDRRPSDPLVFALEHHYSKRSLSLELLKGADLTLAQSVVASAKTIGCSIYMAQIERHVMYEADDRIYGRHSYRNATGKITISSIIEDEIAGVDWVDLNGKKQPWGSLAFDLSSIISTIPINDWKPTREEYEGYTGNAGNTLDRWYHRSVIVVWHSDKQFDVIAKSGRLNCVLLFQSMLKKMAKCPKKDRGRIHDECVKFARIIIKTWPVNEYGYVIYDDEDQKDDLVLSIVNLHDREATCHLMARLHSMYPRPRINKFVAAVCEEYGWMTFAKDLKRAFTSDRDADVPLEEIRCLHAICTNNSTDPRRLDLAQELSSLIVERYLPWTPTSRFHWYFQRHNLNFLDYHIVLVQSLILGEAGDDLNRIVRIFLDTPTLFCVEKFHVPILKSLVVWSNDTFGKTYPGIAQWLDEIRTRLRKDTSNPPEPPAEMARPAKIDCGCKHCTAISKFLGDPVGKSLQIQAGESEREHITNKIRSNQCDIHASLSKQKRPYSLIMTKTLGSFERATKQYAIDLKSLAALPQ